MSTQERFFPCYTPIPDDVFDVWLGELTGLELKVLLCVCRYEFGFGHAPPVSDLQIANATKASAQQLDVSLDGLLRRRLIEPYPPPASEIASGPARWFRLRFAEAPIAAVPIVAPEALPGPRRRQPGKKATLLRARVFTRDRGFCRQCRFDAAAMEVQLADLRQRADDEGRTELERLTASLRTRGFVTHVGGSPRSLWDMDHIVPVVDGGTDDLDNLRTLCTPCHKADTAELMRRLASRRRPS